MDGIANHFPAQNALDCRIVHIQSQNVSRGDTPDPRRSAPGVWTKTSISTCLASVSIVPFYKTTTSEGEHFARS